ncbi:calcium-binding protein [Palleronia pelagia]|uniref:Hemolysin-type calcium-binding repeat-containing protein n=1 Tax=Palleronia pelagia TaxID=387096 RepID=A0A1H8AGK8_9RHOB|nr:calcium-binding protein [Palleronia pelagia]SEM69626.1 Hemolysin-type calcium-binding repeat-containing protein [Palleronia pelagia]
MIMRVTSNDIEVVFLGLRGSGTFELYGATGTGELVPLFRPDSQISGGDQTLGSMGIAQVNLADVQGDLWFTSLETVYSEAGGNRAQGLNVVVHRITHEGILDSGIARFENAQATGYQWSSFWPSAIDWQGNYTLPILDGDLGGRLGVVNGDVYTVSLSGEITQLSNLFRDGGHPDAALAGLGDTLYYIADQQSPLGSDELWRRNADGTNDFVFVDPLGDVRDLDSFGGAVWFTVDYGATSGVSDPGFYRIGSDGVVQAVDLSDAGSLFRLGLILKEQDGRLLLYSTYGDLFEVAPDGGLTQLLQEGELGIIRDVVLFANRIYLAADGPGGSQQLYRLSDNGTVNTVPGIGSLSGDFGVGVFAATEERLYMRGNAVIDDGFGGVEMIGGNLWVMDADETLTRLTGEQSANPDMRGVGALFSHEIDVPEGLFGTVEDDRLVDGEGSSLLEGYAGNDLLIGNAGNDTLRGGDGLDTLVGGDGDDLIEGGETGADLRDNIYGGDGDDTIDGGHGNDELRGDAGNDSIAGGFGADTVIGGAGDDTLTGSAFGDLIFGGDGLDFVNGGFGSDRVNGGAGGDRFFHVGIADHGSDWIQDYNAAEGDVLVYGGSATRDEFQMNVTTTPTAGADDVQEAFVIYRPTGQILWALVDGDGQDAINLSFGGQVFDLTA